MLFEFRGVLVSGGQRMPIRDEEIALILVLQFDPVLQRAVEISQV
jgi:hypothetical protein